MYYALVLEKDLFEDWIITRRYGGKGIKGSHEIKEGYRVYCDAKKRFDCLFEYRIKQRKWGVRVLSFSKKHLLCGVNHTRGWDW